MRGAGVWWVIGVWTCLRAIWKALTCRFYYSDGLAGTRRRGQQHAVERRTADVTPRGCWCGCEARRRRVTAAAREGAQAAEYVACSVAERLGSVYYLRLLFTMVSGTDEGREADLRWLALPRGQGA
ncbi:hypothetical protein BC628DRAFT_120141 [Trametes gibbosa]|nr:hypothetical protein BC628DRAFT_120141 [Trametes gibbosa]